MNVAARESRQYRKPHQGEGVDYVLTCTFMRSFQVCDDVLIEIASASLPMLPLLLLDCRLRSASSPCDWSAIVASPNKSNAFCNRASASMGGGGGGGMLPTPATMQHKVIRYERDGILSACVLEACRVCMRYSLRNFSSLALFVLQNRASLPASSLASLA